MHRITVPINKSLLNWNATLLKVPSISHRHRVTEESRCDSLLNEGSLIWAQMAAWTDKLNSARATNSAQGNFMERQGAMETHVRRAAAVDVTIDVTITFLSFSSLLSWLLIASASVSTRHRPPSELRVEWIV